MSESSTITEEILPRDGSSSEESHVPSVIILDGESASRIFLGVEWSRFKEGDCESCYVFRDIVHGNERWVSKLSLHVHSNNTQHAVHVCELVIEAIPAKKYIADVGSMDVESVQQMLVDYCTGCVRDGLKLIKECSGHRCIPMPTKMDISDQFSSITPMNYQSSTPVLDLNKSTDDADEDMSEIDSLQITRRSNNAKRKT